MRDTCIRNNLRRSPEIIGAENHLSYIQMEYVILQLFWSINDIIPKNNFCQ